MGIWFWNVGARDGAVRAYMDVLAAFPEPKPHEPPLQRIQILAAFAELSVGLSVTVEISLIAVSSIV